MQASRSSTQSPAAGRRPASTRRRPAVFTVSSSSAVRTTKVDPYSATTRAGVREGSKEASWRLKNELQPRARSEPRGSGMGIGVLGPDEVGP